MDGKRIELASIDMIDSASIQIRQKKKFASNPWEDNASLDARQNELNLPKCSYNI